MDTPTKTIATIVPERIPGFEMEFKRDAKTGDFTHDYAAELTVKIGNDARKLRFNKTEKYHGREYGKDENGNTITLKESYSEELVGIDPYTQPFEDLEKVGIAVDVTSLVDEYTSKLLVAIEEQEELKRARFKNNYERSWIHTGLTELLASKKYNKEVTITKSSMGEYGKYEPTPSLTLKYKEQEVRMTLERVSTGGRYSRASELRYKIDGRITPGYRGKYYRTAEMCLVKFVALVDEALAIQKATLTRKEKVEAERTEKAAKLGETFGMKASFSVETKYYQGRTRYTRGDSYEEVSYWLHNNGKKYKIYDSGAEKPERYSMGGFSELTVEKVKAIIQILSK